MREITDETKRVYDALTDTGGSCHYHEPIDIPVQYVEKAVDRDTKKAISYEQNSRPNGVSVIDVTYRACKPATYPEPSVNTSEHNYDIVDFENNYLIELPPPAQFQYQNNSLDTNGGRIIDENQVASSTKIYKSIINITSENSKEPPTRSNMESQHSSGVYNTSGRNPNEDFRSLNEINLPNESMLAFDTESEGYNTIGRSTQFRFSVSNEGEMNTAEKIKPQQQQQQQPFRTDLGNIINEIRSFNSAKLKHINDRIEAKIYQNNESKLNSSNVDSSNNMTKTRQRINEINQMLNSSNNILHPDSDHLY